MKTVVARKISLAALSVGLVVLFTGCPLPAGNYVFFRDPALESAVRAALRQPFLFLTQTDVNRLYRLDARNLNIESLEGLEYCQNLTWLNLEGNKITDLGPLENLTNLRTLILDNNDITDISPLAGLLNLDMLSLFNNEVGDIQALVANANNGGLGPGDQVILDVRKLSERALTIDVPTLQTTYEVNVILVTEASSR